MTTAGPQAGPRAHPASPRVNPSLTNAAEVRIQRGSTLNGYHFKYRERHLGLDRPVPGISVLVVARNAAEAYVAAGRVMPIEGIRLLESGREILDLARAQGVVDGHALVLNTALDGIAAAA